MATYKQIQAYVRQHNGFSVKTCWIADVKEAHGLLSRVAPNRKSFDRRENPCPEGKRPAIEAAFSDFGMI